MEATDPWDISRSLEEGPAILSWQEFRHVGPWGDSGASLPAADRCAVTVATPMVSVVANALALPLLLGGDDNGQQPVEVCLALAAAAAGLPDPHLYAREVSWA